MPLQIRRGLNAERTQITPTEGLVEGELLYVTDEKKLYIGTGSVGEHQGVVITGYNDSNAKDAAAEIFADGDHNGINFTYDDETKALNASVDLSNYQGILRADAFKGSVFADDGSTIGGKILVDAVAGIIPAEVVSGIFTGNVVGSVVSDSVVTDTLSVDAMESDINSNFRLIFNQQDGTTSSVLIEKNSNDNINPSTLAFQKSRGTSESPAAVTVLDRLGAINFRGFDGTSYLTPSQIRIDVAGPVSTNSIPTATIFSNTDSTGAFLESARLDHSRGLVVSRSGSSASVAAFQSVHDSGASTATFGFSRARGTLTVPSAILENDAIIDLAFSGRTGPLPAFPTTCAFIRVAADGPVSTNVIPGRIEFHTASLLGTLSQKMVLNNSGVLQVNSIEGLTSDLSIAAVSISEFLKLPIYADDTARTAGITTPTQGMVIFMQTGTSPAATNRPQYFDGTSWQNF